MHVLLHLQLIYLVFNLVAFNHDLFDLSFLADDLPFNLVYLQHDLLSYRVNVELSLAHQANQAVGLHTVLVGHREGKLLVDAVKATEECTKVALCSLLRIKPILAHLARGDLDLDILQLLALGLKRLLTRALKVKDSICLVEFKGPFSDLYRGLIAVKLLLLLEEWLLLAICDEFRVKCGATIAANQVKKIAIELHYRHYSS